jgi:hypothetical protein
VSFTVAAHGGGTTTTRYWQQKDAIDGFKDAPAHRELDGMLDRDYWGWSGAPGRRFWRTSLKKNGEILSALTSPGRSTLPR